MRRDISKAEVERLFVGAVDGDLAENDRSRLDTAIESDESLKTDFDKYERAVKLLRESPREEAPDVLASMVMRRVRRRRGPARLAAQVADYRLPVEVIVPLLLAAVVAVALLMSSP